MSKPKQFWVLSRSLKGVVIEVELEPEELEVVILMLDQALNDTRMRQGFLPGAIAKMRVALGKFEAAYDAGGT